MFYVLTRLGGKVIKAEQKGEAYHVANAPSSGNQSQAILALASMGASIRMGDHLGTNECYL